MTYPVGGHWAARVITAGDDDDVLTVDQLKERARIVPGDDESDTLLKDYITAARQQVEHDTGCALPTQDLMVTYDQIDPTGVLVLPWPPLQDVTSIYFQDDQGNNNPLEPGDVIKQMDVASMPARLTWMPNTFVGTPSTVAALALGIKVGWTKDTLPEALRFAVGLLAAHYLTAGRDRVVIGTIVGDMPAGYDEVIQAYKLQVVV